MVKEACRGSLRRIRIAHNTTILPNIVERLLLHRHSSHRRTLRLHSAGEKPE
jgi:hypothetical protein